jgi:hypothetical protein
MTSRRVRAHISFWQLGGSCSVAHARVVAKARVVVGRVDAIVPNSISLRPPPGVSGRRP